MTVQEFICAEMAKPYRDGETDCCNTADRWVRLNHGFSPMGRFGRRPESAQDVQEWLSEPHGLVGGVLRVMRISGLPRANKPKPGDIGLIRIKDQFCMAIFTGRVWFTRNERGIMLGRADSFVRAWSV